MLPKTSGLLSNLWNPVGIQRRNSRRRIVFVELLSLVTVTSAIGLGISAIDVSWQVSALTQDASEPAPGER